MLFKLQKVRSDYDGFLHLSELSKTWRNVLDEKLKLDFSHCSHFDANMAAPLAAVLNRVNDNKNAIQIVGATSEVENILRKNRFLKKYGYGELEDINHTTLPFLHIPNSDTQSFAGYLSRNMNGKGIPRMTAELEKAFRRSIFEIFQNCVSHSASDRGVFVCGQFYPYGGRLDLTISDVGIGIRTNVRRFFRNNNLSSIDAIKWALKEGSTTKTGELPGGMGLKLLKDFIVHNNGKIQIVSRQGFYQLAKGKEVYQKLGYDFPGTTINLEINSKDKHSYRLSNQVTPDNVF